MSRRSRTGGDATLVVLCVVALLIVQGPLGLGAFGAGVVERSPHLSVVDDRNGGMDIYPHHAMNSGETCTLVDLTNNVGSNLTVTVSLREDSQSYGNLTLGNGNEGNETTFQLDAGASQRVGIELDSSIPDGTSVYFHVNATGDPVSIVATDRHSTVNDSTSTTRCDITL